MMIKKLDKHELRRLIYHIRHDYLTLNNVIIAGAVLIALSWAWGSVEAMQRNYHLQQLLDNKKQQVELETLKVSLAEYEAKYYQTVEYQDFAVRQRLGHGSPGEKQLIVPSTDVETEKTATVSKQQLTESNLQQWTNFLFGANRKKS